MPSVISAAGISVIKDKKEILKVDQLDLGPGEVLSVLGPNGAGKSTLLQVMALLLPPSAGQVSFRGEPVTRRNALLIRRRMAVVFQEPLLLNTTVRNNVAQGLKLRGVPRTEIGPRVEFWLGRLGISHLAGRGNRHLSGGEAQRVNLARALALQPEVLFLDEPFTSLDYLTRTDLLVEISQIIRENGITTFFVTHDYSEVSCFGGQALVLNGGRIAFRGDAGAVADGFSRHISAASGRILSRLEGKTGPPVESDSNHL